MSDAIEIERIEEEYVHRDFPRANGAPLVTDPEDPTRRLRYSRPSGYGKILDDEQALVWWRIWKAMEGVARSPALSAQILATKDEDRETKKALREQALDKGTANESADLGTALHAMTARMEDQNDPWAAPEQYREDLEAYLATIRRYGLVSEMIEVPMVADDFRAAGTTDRIYRLTRPLVTPDGLTLPIGELIIGDIKTGGKLDFSAPGYCVQMALYAEGRLYDLLTERRLPTPPINRHWTILVHLPVGKGLCNLHWCSVDVGLQGAMYAQFVKEWQRQWKNGTFDTPRITEPQTIEALIESELGAVPVDEPFTPEPLDDLVSFVAERVAQCGRHPGAREELMRRWPVGVPTPRQGLSDPGDLERVMHVLDAVEAAHSLSFVHDPRVEAHRGLHRTSVKQLNDQGANDQ